MIAAAVRKICILLLVALMVPGCARLVLPDRPMEQTAPAREHLARFSRENEDIPPYKGIGRLEVVSGKEAWSVRGAWLAVPEQGFRVETVGLAGHPGARLICDTSECYFLYTENGCYRKRSTRRTNLKPLAGIDMDVADLVVLLGGGVPVLSHDAAWMAKGADGAGPVMKLSRQFYGEVGKIHFLPDMSDVRAVEVFGLTGLKYRAQIVSTRMVDGYRVPDVLKIENNKASVVLKVEKAWFDVSFLPDAFVPKLPENHTCD